MQIRAVRPDETDQFLHVFCAAFGIDPADAAELFYSDPFYELAFKRVSLDDDDRIASCLTIIPAEMRVGGALLPVAGFAGLATLPTHQRRGYAGALLTATLRSVPTQFGIPICCLFPEEAGYYRRFGFVEAAAARRWACSEKDMLRAAAQELAATPATPATFATGGVARVTNTTVRQADPTDPADVGAIAGIWEAMTGGRTGSCLRGKRRWMVIYNVLSAGTFLVAEVGGSVEGYVHFEPTQTAGRILINEMYARTDLAAAALLTFLAEWEIVDEVEWPACDDDLARFHLPASGPIVPDGMLRIVDLHHCLALAHPAQFAPILQRSNQKLTIHATDPIIVDNERAITLSSGGAIASAGAVIESISAPIDVITQLFMGYCTPSTSAESGELAASSAEALNLADQLFPLRAPFIPGLDHF